MIKLVKMGNRIDLCDFVLIIIDLDDVKDYDDVVWVVFDEDLNNKGGWVVMVVIVDVVVYVEYGGVLDCGVFKCGNLVYLLDCVVLMLFECLFNDLCFLCELEECFCLVVWMVFDKNGNKCLYIFIWGWMKLVVKLVYIDV